jgi:UDP-N-acetylmuramate--alanine ligase
MTLRDISELRTHFVGIGGSGMSGIAKVIAARGGFVSGSDIHESVALDGLRAQGIKIYVGHDADNIKDADLIVRSSAIPDSNPEIVSARSNGIRILGRAEALAELLIGRRSVAVAGTHGKTTTTSMLTVALQRSGLDPSFAIGASIKNSGTNAHHGSGDIFVEADESDGSFTSYKPTGAIITNIELDHVDNFKDIDQIDQLFEDFTNTVSEFLVVCSDDPGVGRLINRITESSVKLITYGATGDPDYLINRVVLNPKGSIARITSKGRVLGELNLLVPGAHNLLNATAALAASIELGAPYQSVLDGLNSFTGARRRFEIKGTVDGVTVVDDYGHHPTEIKATLETARRYVGAGRILVVYQPHRFSRTQAFLPAFAEELAKADHTYLLEIYPAGEEPIPGVTSAAIAKRMAKEKVTYEPSMPEVISKVVADAKSGDLVVTLGAGDVSSLAPLILENLQNQ